MLLRPEFLNPSTVIFRKVEKNTLKFKKTNTKDFD